MRKLNGITAQSLGFDAEAADTVTVSLTGDANGVNAFVGFFDTGIEINSDPNAPFTAGFRSGFLPGLSQGQLETLTILHELGHLVQADYGVGGITPDGDVIGDLTGIVSLGNSYLVQADWFGGSGQ
jgi:hypothetical protein